MSDDCLFTYFDDVENAKLFVWLYLGTRVDNRTVIIIITATASDLDTPTYTTTTSVNRFQKRVAIFHVSS